MVFQSFSAELRKRTPIQLFGKEATLLTFDTSPGCDISHEEGKNRSCNSFVLIECVDENILPIDRTGRLVKTRCRLQERKQRDAPNNRTARIVLVTTMSNRREYSEEVLLSNK